MAITIACGCRRSCRGPLIREYFEGKPIKRKEGFVGALERHGASSVVAPAWAVDIHRDQKTRGCLINLNVGRRLRASMASEPRERSAPAKRRARERVGESEGRSPSDKTCRERGMTCVQSSRV